MTSRTVGAPTTTRPKNRPAGSVGVRTAATVTAARSVNRTRTDAVPTGATPTTRVTVGSA